MRKSIIAVFIYLAVIGGNVFAQANHVCDHLFMEAVKQDLTRDILEHLRHQWGNINYQDPISGMTALMWVIDKGNSATLRMFLNEGKGKGQINMNLADNNGMTTLMHAVKKGDTVIMDILMSDGALINPNTQRDGTRDTALHYAVEQKNTDMVNCLLKNKLTQTTLVDKNGNTAFMIAVKNDNKVMVRLFGNSEGFDVTARPIGIAFPVPPLLVAIENTLPIPMIGEILKIKNAMYSTDDDGDDAYDYLERSRYNKRQKDDIKDLLDEAKRRSSPRRN